MLLVSKEENVIVNIDNIEVLSVVDDNTISIWGSSSGIRKRLCIYSSYENACTAFSELISRIERSSGKGVVYIPTEEEIEERK